MCVLICPLGYFSNTNNGLCEDKCTTSRFAYSPTHQCLDTCIKPYFGSNDGTGVRTCVLKCPDTTYAEGRTCESGCATLFADDLTNSCV